MSIRNRTLQFRNGPQLAASQSAVVMGVWVAPAAGRITAIDAYLVTKTGAAAAQVGVYKSATDTAADTAANSTTLMHSAVLDMTSAAWTSATMNTDGTQYFVKGEYVYVKYTTGSTTTMDDLCVTVKVDY
jgi:hypothetical protein